MIQNALKFKFKAFRVHKYQAIIVHAASFLHLNPLILCYLLKFYQSVLFC